MTLREELLERVREAGFTRARICAYEGNTPGMEAYDQWLQRGDHGGLGYLETGRDVRASPHARLASLRSVLVLGVDHHHDVPPDPGGLTGRVARYAWGRDYHNLVGKRLKRLIRDLRKSGVGCWGGVDTAPIFERAWAQKAGLGFSGKNTLQIVPATTSWFFLAVVFLDVELTPDVPLGNHCGACTRCLDACPTKAFRGPNSLDSRRCISYWTIEHKGEIPLSMHSGMGRWLFGCDVCQEVCPHNVGCDAAEEDDFLPRNAWIDLDWLLFSDPQEVRERFVGTPLRRPGVEGLRRNGLIVLRNIGTSDAIAALESVADGQDATLSAYARASLGTLA